MKFRNILISVPSVILYLSMIYYFTTAQDNLMQIYFLEFISVFCIFFVIIIANKKTGFLSSREYSVAIYLIFLIALLLMGFSLSFKPGDNLDFSIKNFSIFGYFLISLIVKFITLRYSKTEKNLEIEVANWTIMLASGCLSAGTMAFFTIFRIMTSIEPIVTAGFMYYLLMMLLPPIKEIYEEKTGKPFIRYVY